MLCYYQCNIYPCNDISISNKEKTLIIILNFLKAQNDKKKIIVNINDSNCEILIVNKNYLQ